MINAKEGAIIVLVSIVLAFTISLVESLNLFLSTLLSVFLVIAVNILAKKFAAFMLESEIEIRLWEIRQWGFKPHKHFKKPIPAGIIFPLAVAFLSIGYIYWLASLVFDINSKAYRAAKRWGLYTFSEVTEYHIGWIAAWGVIANLLFAIIGYFAGFMEFAKLNIFFALFNMIPFSNLDGNKIYFGNVVLWSFLAILTLIGLGYVIFLI